MSILAKILSSLGYSLLVAFVVYAVVHYENVLRDTGSLLLLAGAAVLVTLYSAVKVGDIWRQGEDE